MNHRIMYLRDNDNNPVGCLAYRTVTPRGNRETIAFGLSFLNAEIDSANRKAARRVAEGRLALALTEETRANQQGRWGQVVCIGRNVNEKVANLLSQLSSHDHSLHRNPEKDSEMKVRLAAQIGRLKRVKVA